MPAANAAAARRAVRPRPQCAPAPQASPQPNNPLPFSRGNSAERTEAVPAERARGAETPPDAAAARAGAAEAGGADCPRPIAGCAGLSRRRRPPPARSATRCATCDAVRPERDVQQPAGRREGSRARPSSSTPRAWSSARGSAASSPQVRRNWFVPEAAFTFHGRVVLQFNIHRDGHITDLVVVAAVGDRRLQPRGVQRHPRVEPDRAAAAGVPRRPARSSPSRSTTTSARQLGEAPPWGRASGSARHADSHATARPPPAARRARRVRGMARGVSRR